MRVPFLGLTTLAALSCVATFAEDPGTTPLAPLEDVVKRLDAGIEAVLGGKAPDQAFLPWRVEIEDREAFQNALKRAGVVRARCWNIHLVLAWFEAGKPAFSAVISIYTFDGQSSIEGVVVYDVPGSEPAPPYNAARDLAACQREQAPFANTADGLICQLRGTLWDKLPVLDVERISKVLPEGKTRLRYSEGLRETRGQLGDHPIQTTREAGNL